ncbi:MAG: hypothetical protein AAFY20_01980 [Cyanobacteria bacterium J06639_14]
MLRTQRSRVGWTCLAVTLLAGGCSDRPQMLVETIDEPHPCLADVSTARGELLQDDTVNEPSHSTDVTLETYDLAPQSTDIAIDDWLEAHYVAIDPSVSPRHQLFLFFGGSHGQPSQQQLIVQQAARLGMHAINLRYPNAWTVGELCRRSRDENCHAKVRLEILEGTNHSDLVEVTRPNSIANRLVKLLRYLHEQNPEQGWSSYLQGDAVQWGAIVVAGHSQGGGHAALIGKHHPVAKVVMLAAPADYSRTLKTPAPWLAQPGVTPPERYYGFVHTQDPGSDRIQQAWQLLRMAPQEAPTYVDTQVPPYNCAHQLITAADPAIRGKFHGSVATDRTTPKLPDGTPLFQDVWQYLMLAEPE